MKAKRNKLVFIVEDNEMYSIMLDYALSNDNSVQYMFFKTGEECLENLNLNPMLIILDYWLPGINGLETFKKIKKYNSKIPVVILTHDHNIDIATALLNEGVKDYFNKEKESIPQIKEIINSELFKITEAEEKKVFKMKAAVCCLFLIAIITVVFYLKQFW